MKKKWSHLTGRKYTHLTVVYPVDDISWRCSCTCGKMLTVLEVDLTSRKATSCGCLPPLDKSGRWFGDQCWKHGYSGTPTYICWQGMKQRCHNPKARGFKDYGGRGITVCDRWMDSFEAFIDDMGPRPDDLLSIGRINNDGNYEPGNCRWATRSQQMNNKRKSNGDT